MVTILVYPASQPSVSSPFISRVWTVSTILFQPPDVIGCAVVTSYAISQCYILGDGPCAPVPGQGDKMRELKFKSPSLLINYT